MNETKPTLARLWRLLQGFPGLTQKEVQWELKLGEKAAATRLDKGIRNGLFVRVKDEKDSRVWKHYLKEAV